MTCSPRPKLIAIIGATGTGKSDLAVYLARRFDGEVINTDAMQMYSGLPIMTNKIPVAEQQGVPHHLLGCVDPLGPAWTVQRFVHAARASIADVLQRGRVPVLVGGTHYYTQSLLCADQVVAATEGTDTPRGDGGEKRDAVDRHPILGRPTAEILQRLTEVDPAMARRWHPNDRRKIMRSLEIYLDTGRRASDIYAGQRETAMGEDERRTWDRVGLPDGGQLVLDGGDGGARQYDPLILWVHAEHATLAARLDERVVRMVDGGLLDEVRELTAHAAASDGDLDMTSGIWQSLGYKQFLDYLRRLDGDAVTDGTGANQERQLTTMYRTALEATQAGTRRYAKSQVRWIRIKLLNALGELGRAQMYVLDGTDGQSYAEMVLGSAEAVVERFIAGEALPDKEEVGGVEAKRLLMPKAEDMRTLPWEPRRCEACDVTCTNPSLWQQHVDSRAHRRLARGVR